MLEQRRGAPYDGGAARRRACSSPRQSKPNGEARPPAPRPSTGRALGEAITALRRGEPVLIRDDEISVLAVAAELVTEENLRRLREMSRAPARVVLTRRRAVALGLAPRDELSGALTISVSSDLPRRGDPQPRRSRRPRSARSRPGSAPKPLAAKGGALAAVALAKLASLLPAALVLRAGTER